MRTVDFEREYLGRWSEPTRCDVKVWATGERCDEKARFRLDMGDSKPAHVCDRCLSGWLTLLTANGRTVAVSALGKGR